MASLTEATIAAVAADAEWVRANPCGPTWTRPPYEQVRRLIAAEWERAEAAEARLAEARDTIATFLAVRGGGQGAQDLAEALRQVLDRKGPGDA